MAIKQIIIITLISAIFCRTVSGANILALYGVTSPSHHIWNSVLINELSARGHNVTILSVDIPKNSANIPKNAHYIHLKEAYSILYNASYSDIHVDINSYLGTGIFSGIFTLYDFCYKSAEAVLKSSGHEILLNYPDDFKFDLVISDYTCGSYLLGYLHKFKYPPLIGISAFLNPPSTVDQVGGHKYPAYTPYFSLSYGMPMTFCERMKNTLVFIVDFMYRTYVQIPRMDKLIRSYTKMDIPYLAEMEHRTVLALVNSHPAVDYSEPLPPNVIEIGGMQLLDPKPLPKDINEFISNSQKGGIFFSLGTNMKTSDLGPERCQIILDAMSEMPEYNFLWKSDIDEKEYKIPKNVLIRSFFPQTDILAHPKLKAFVTHCGGLSTQEAIWRGVPMVGLPLFADQHGNLQRTLRYGVSEKIIYMDLSVKILRDTIRKVAGNPKYAKNMEILSNRYKDRPMKALDTATWWIEYVLRNPQPTHLRSPVIELGFIRANSLDFVLILFLIVVMFAWILLTLCKICLCNKQDIVKKKTVRIDKKVKYN